MTAVESTISIEKESTIQPYETWAKIEESLDKSSLEFHAEFAHPFSVVAAPTGWLFKFAESVDELGHKERIFVVSTWFEHLETSPTATLPPQKKRKTSLSVADMVADEVESILANNIEDGILSAHPTFQYVVNAAVQWCLPSSENISRFASWIVKGAATPATPALIPVVIKGLVSKADFDLLISLHDRSTSSVQKILLSLCIRSKRLDMLDHFAKLRLPEVPDFFEFCSHDFCKQAVKDHPEYFRTTALKPILSSEPDLWLELIESFLKTDITTVNDLNMRWSLILKSVPKNLPKTVATKLWDLYYEYTPVKTTAQLAKNYIIGVDDPRAILAHDDIIFSLVAKKIGVNQWLQFIDTNISKNLWQPFILKLYRYLNTFNFRRSASYGNEVMFSHVLEILKSVNAKIWNPSSDFEASVATYFVNSIFTDCVWIRRISCPKMKLLFEILEQIWQSDLKTLKDITESESVNQVRTIFKIPTYVAAATQHYNFIVNAFSFVHDNLSNRVDAMKKKKGNVAEILGATIHDMIEFLRRTSESLKFPIDSQVQVKTIFLLLENPKTKPEKPTLEKLFCVLFANFDTVQFVPLVVRLASYEFLSASDISYLSELVTLKSAILKAISIDRTLAIPYLAGALELCKVYNAKDKNGKSIPVPSDLKKYLPLDFALAIISSTLLQSNLNHENNSRLRKLLIPKLDLTSVLKYTFEWVDGVAANSDPNTVSSLEKLIGREWMDYLVNFIVTHLGNPKEVSNFNKIVDGFNRTVFGQRLLIELVASVMMNANIASPELRIYFADDWKVEDGLQANAHDPHAPIFKLLKFIPFTNEKLRRYYKRSLDLEREVPRKLAIYDVIANNCLFMNAFEVEDMFLCFAKWAYPFLRKIDWARWGATHPIMLFLGKGNLYTPAKETKKLVQRFEHIETFIQLLASVIEDVLVREIKVAGYMLGKLESVITPLVITFLKDKSDDAVSLYWLQFLFKYKYKHSVLNLGLEHAASRFLYEYYGEIDESIWLNCYKMVLPEEQYKLMTGTISDIKQLNTYLVSRWAQIFKINRGISKVVESIIQGLDNLKSEIKADIFFKNGITTEKFLSLSKYRENDRKEKDKQKMTNFSEKFLNCYVNLLKQLEPPQNQIQELTYAYGKLKVAPVEIAMKFLDWNSKLLNNDFVAKTLWDQRPELMIKLDKRAWYSAKLSSFSTRGRLELADRLFKDAFNSDGVNLSRRVAAATLLRSYECFTVEMITERWEELKKLENIPLQVKENIASLALAPGLPIKKVLAFVLSDEVTTDRDVGLKILGGLQSLSEIHESVFFTTFEEVISKIKLGVVAMKATIRILETSERGLSLLLKFWRIRDSLHQDVVYNLILAFVTMLDHVGVTNNSLWSVFKQPDIAHSLACPVKVVYDHYNKIYIEDVTNALKNLKVTTIHSVEACRQYFYRVFFPLLKSSQPILQAAAITSVLNWIGLTDEIDVALEQSLIDIFLNTPLTTFKYPEIVKESISKAYSIAKYRFREETNTVMMKKANKRFERILKEMLHTMLTSDMFIAHKVYMLLELGLKVGKDNRQSKEELKNILATCRIVADVLKLHVKDLDTNENERKGREAGAETVTVAAPPASNINFLSMARASTTFIEDLTIDDDEDWGAEICTIVKQKLLHTKGDA